MKLKVQFIGSLAMINAYFMGFAYGFNYQHVLVVDPSLPAVKVAPEPQAATVDKDKSKAAAKIPGSEKNAVTSAKKNKSNSPKHRSDRADKNKTSKHEKSKARANGPKKE